MVTTEEERNKVSVKKLTVSCPDNSDLTSLFHETFGRDPTEQDLDWLEGELCKYDLKRKGFTSHNKHGGQGSISAGMSALQQTYHTDTAVLQALFSEKAKTENAALKEIQLKKTKRKEAFSKGISLVARFALLGVLSGTGTATYFALKEPIVSEAVRYYENKTKEQERAYGARISELENKFFGPLNTLTTVSGTTSLSPLERELYLRAYFGEEIMRGFYGTDNTIIDKSSGDVRLLLQQIYFKDGRKNNQSRLLLSKILEGGVVEAYLYDGESLTDAEPLKYISFQNDSATVVNYDNDRFWQIRDNKNIYEGNTDNTPYKAHAEKILQELQSLHSRGPNTNTIIP